MKEKTLWQAILLLSMPLAIFIQSCKDPKPSTEERPVTSSSVFEACLDSLKGDIIYRKDGYILLKDPDFNDSLGVVDKFSAPIKDAEAAQMIRHFIRNRPAASTNGFRYPYVIDFDFTTMNDLLKELNTIDPVAHEKKSVRIYFGSYNQAALDVLYRGETTLQRQAKLNYLTAVLVGRYDNIERTTAYNLGNICPPNCPDPPGTPDRSTSRLFDQAMRLP